MRHHHLLTCALAVSLTFAAPPQQAQAATQQSIAIDFAGTAATPAAQVPGARTGGRVTWLQDGAPAHLDPQQIYDVIDIATDLFHRTLTGYVEDPNGGQLRLIGDLATNAGEPTDGGRVWTYHLRPGITFADGSPITSRDIAYGIARSFGEQGVFGPHYLQPALDPLGSYPGPAGGQDVPPGISLPDDSTLVFTFPAAHPEMPYLAAMPTTTPVPKAQDTGAGYDSSWIATGPYQKIAEEPGVSLTLGRNPHWNPASDPIRHQYADTIKFEWATDRASQTNRLLNPVGDDAAAVMTANVAADQIDAVLADPALAARTLAGPTPTAKYININTQRVPDFSIRAALNWAFDRGALVQAQGGSAVADPSTTILAPTVPGYLAYDAYPSAGHGDVRRAKKLLHGRTPSLRYCFPGTADDAAQAAVAEAGLERAGFQITLAPLDPNNYWGLVGTRTTTCDLIYSAWVGDYPDAHTTLGVILNGNLIGDEGNINFSYFDDPCVNAELDRLAAVTDRPTAATEYGDLDQQIMIEHAPLIPTVYAKAFLLRGPAVGGTFLSGLFGRPNLTGVYVLS